MSDSVNHPKHYNASPSGVECITVVEHMSFNVGNAMKYLWRADEKGNAVEDLRKAEWYVRREIERREKAAATAEFADVVWKGCGECDCSFPCHGGKERCFRLG